MGERVALRTHVGGAGGTLWQDRDGGHGMTVGTTPGGKGTTAPGPDARLHRSLHQQGAKPGESSGGVSAE